MSRLALVLGLLLLAACQTTPPPPLLSPITATGAYGYGYAERRVGPEDWEVTYVGPVRRAPLYGGSREADQAAARTQAFDFMLWRAAQIALSEGFTAFRVGQTRSNVDTRVEDYGYDPFYGPGWGPWGPGWGVNRFYYPYFPPYPYARSASAYLQARISGDVHLLHAAAPGDYVAEDVIAQARRTYPGAEPAPPGSG
jgi:hypothetical protein